MFNSSHSNPFIDWLTHIADLILVNICMLLFSLPVFTLGAAATAAGKVVYDISEQACGKVIPAFFRTFKSNFKYSSAIWCVSILIMLSLVACYVITFSVEASVVYRIWFVIAVIFAFALLAVVEYTFFLIGRYENRLPEHIKNAAILALCNAPRTLLLIALDFIPFMLLFYFTAIFFYLLPFWVLIGFALIMRLKVAVIKPIIKKLDEKP